MGTPTWRQRKMEELGAHVVRHGETLSDAAAECGTLSHAPRLTAKPCFPAAGDALARLDGPNRLRRFLPSVCCFSLRMPERLAATSGQTIVHPYDDPLVIAGHGTIGLEILAQLKERRHCFRPCIPHRGASGRRPAGARGCATAAAPLRVYPAGSAPASVPCRLDAIFCCVGGGGLVSGIAAYVKSVRPDVRCVRCAASAATRHGPRAWRSPDRSGRICDSVVVG